MSAFLTLYVLIWPAVVAVILAVIVRAFFREVQKAREAGRRLI